jgi:hypothetical protein
MSPVGLGTKNHCAGEGQQQFSSQSVSWVSCRRGLLVRLSPAGKDVSMEAEEYLLLRAVTRQRLVTTHETLCVLQYSNL